MKRIVCFAMFGAVLMAATSVASAHELTRKERKFSVFGGFTADVGSDAMGGVLGMEFRLHQSSDVLVIGLAPCVSILQGQTPINFGVNPGAKTLFVQATANFRLRFILADIVALVGEAGLGVDHLNHNEAVPADGMLIEEGSHSAFMVSWGLMLEFRLSDMFRLSGFYHGGHAWNQLFELNMSNGAKGAVTRHKLGLLLSIFFE